MKGSDWAGVSLIVQLFIWILVLPFTVMLFALKLVLVFLSIFSGAFLFSKRK